MSTWEAGIRHKVAVMRELGVAADAGLVLGPPVVPRPKMKKGEKDPLAERRAHYENLLGRALSDDEIGKLP